MPEPRGRSASELTALAGSALIVVLLMLAAAGVGDRSSVKILGLRVLPFTLAVTLLPIPGIAWVVALWTRPMPSGGRKFVRVTATVLLILLSVVCAVFTIFVVIFRPVPRSM